MGAREVSFAVKSALFKRQAGSLYTELIRNQTLPPGALASMTAERSRRIAEFAMRESAFYREAYADAGVTLADLADPQAFASLPIIDRSVVKEHADNFRTSEAIPENVREALTGGSTGQPLRTVNDARVPTSALGWRMYSWWGVRPSDNVAHIGRWTLSRSARIKREIMWWPTQETFLDAGNVDRQAKEEFFTRIRRTRPVLIEGYLGIVNELATEILSAGIQLPPARAIGVTAAPLTESLRRHIEEAFKAPVFDQYRSSEVQWMAGECRMQDGLHIFSDMRRIEVVGDDGRALPAGEVGDVVVTDLANRVFPIIRYRLGDRGALREGACRCGVTLPLLEPPDGRTVDMIRLPDGTVVGGGLFTIFSATPDAVRLFQMHQNSDYSIQLRVLLGPGPNARSDVEAVAQSLRARFHGQVPIEVVYVDSLPHVRGKIKYVTSDVPASR